MHKSRSCFRVTHNGLVTAVPVSYLTIIQSKDFDTTEQEAIRLALELVLNRKVSDGENPIVDKTQVIDEKGDVIDSSTDMFTVIDGSNAYYLKYNPTGEEHCIGDGVDSLSFDPVTLHPGTLGFTELWTEIVNKDGDYKEAYFPDTDDDEDDQVTEDKDRRRGLYGPEYPGEQF